MGPISVLMPRIKYTWIYFIPFVKLEAENAEKEKVPEEKSEESKEERKEEAMETDDNKVRSLTSRFLL